jgi:hypothetical protein
VNLSLVTVMEPCRTRVHLSHWRMLMDLAGGANLHFTYFAGHEVGGVVEDRDTPELSGCIQFRHSSGKNAPDLGQQEPVDPRAHSYRQKRCWCRGWFLVLCHS